MARSLKKGPFVSVKLAKKIAIAIESNIFPDILPRDHAL